MKRESILNIRRLQSVLATHPLEERDQTLPNLSYLLSGEQRMKLSALNTFTLLNSHLKELNDKISLRK